MTSSPGSSDPFVIDIHRGFSRNVRFWALRWTIGLSAMGWFAYQFPKHWWVLLIGLGMALISLSVLIIGRRIVLRRHAEARGKGDSFNQD